MPVHRELGQLPVRWIQKYAVSLIPPGTREYRGVHKGSNHAVQMVFSEVPLGSKLREHSIFHITGVLGFRA